MSQYSKLRLLLLHKVFYYTNHLHSIFYKLLNIIDPYPLVLHLRTTTRCNLSCPFCYLKDGLNKKEDNLLSMEEWEKVLVKIPRFHILDITGAEPFLMNNFHEFCALITRLGFRASITTNGTIYNNKILETLERSSINYIMISIDGLKETHNKLRGSETAFARTIQFIKELNEIKKRKPFMKINIKTMLIDENIDEYIEFLETLENEVSFDALTINIPFTNLARGGNPLKTNINHPNLHTGNTFEFEKKEKVKKVITYIFDNKNRFRFPIIFKPALSKKDLLEYVENPRRFGVKSCNLYKTNLTLYFNGDVTSCDISYRLQNIREINFDLKNATKAPSFLELAKSMKKDRKMCQGCVFTNQEKIGHF